MAGAQARGTSLSFSDGIVFGDNEDRCVPRVNATSRSVIFADKWMLRRRIDDVVMASQIAKIKYFQSQILDLFCLEIPSDRYLTLYNSYIINSNEHFFCTFYFFSLLKIRRNRSNLLMFRVSNFSWKFFLLVF